MRADANRLKRNQTDVIVLFASVSIRLHQIFLSEI